MRIAVPLANGRCGEHFEICDSMAVVDVDVWTRVIIGRNDIALPMQRPEALAGSLVALGVGLVICGDMNPPARRAFRERGIVVLVGAPAQTPQQLVVSYLLSNFVHGAKV